MWWVYVAVVALVVFAVYAFVSVARARTRHYSRRTSRTAENLYDAFGDTPEQQRRYAKEHGGTSRPH